VFAFLPNNIPDTCIWQRSHAGLRLNTGEQEILILTNSGDSLGGISSDARLVKEGAYIVSKEPVETDAIMESLQITADNAAIISFELAAIMISINSGKGTLGRLIQDTTIAENLDRTIVNLRKSSKGLDENMNAAKENFLFKGYFNRKQKEAEQFSKDSLATKEAERKAAEQKKK
jgi:phospholipid/cholesterol/gamma-HCH transport system substrate-binding protein